VLGFPSSIQSLDWCSWFDRASGTLLAPSGPGEVPEAPRVYNGAQPIPYATGRTPCQPAEVFSTGEVLNPDLQPQLYDELGFPLCCANHYTSTGGVEVGGSAIVPVEQTFTTYFTCDMANAAPLFTGGAVGDTFRIPFVPDPLWVRWAPAAGFRIKVISVPDPSGYLFPFGGSCAFPVDGELLGVGDTSTAVWGPGGHDPFFLAFGPGFSGSGPDWVFELVAP